MKGVESKRPSKFRPYYIAPEGKVGVDAFAVIRDVIEAMDRVALGRVVLTSREHVIALEPRGKGLMGTLLRYPYEVRDKSEYFDDNRLATSPRTCSNSPSTSSRPRAATSSQRNSR